MALLKVLRDYRLLDRDWTAGQVVDVDDAQAARLCGMLVQLGAVMVPVLVPATDEDIEAATAPAVVATTAAPPAEVLETVKLETLRAIAADQGVIDAGQLSQRGALEVLTAASEVDAKTNAEAPTGDTAAQDTDAAGAAPSNSGEGEG